MEWIWSLFEKKTSLTDFKAAGCIFTDGNYVLAGYQPKADYNISGFGGKRRNNETYIQTAIRETIEELFDVDPPIYIVDYIEINLKPVYIYLNNSYIIVHYNFKDLVKILEYCQCFANKTPLYDVFPETLSDLIFNRCNYNFSEVQQLCLLPFKSDIKIHDGFKMDIALIKKINAV